MVDGDWFEMRTIQGVLKPVAFIETIQVPFKSVEDMNKRYPLSKAKEAFCLYVEENWLPTYIVWHNPECADFLVQRVKEPNPKR